ncbi:bifunctional tRNA (5-methylaminomethyl-2-thiouridine)(34)-methyltransferase MnmD/FAD-dependent 5-carboxymethylaminomethyl-2-thiouridine(34) oxidoreductase MnmC [Martelella alba]|uniref:tRNA 5-methylaminomethyl-2-thiouridine biosynthesis bifunctional protein MnmC n=1 Tax=Martelella alba TaxID=2590451 RepID=A0ABY2SGZ2_9HYPH|nr:bifunctional tRNA (5-methylaminomethyl-2-thiouridine)(34)-methyltransferase MnmD/FAD-dependent 5-carboxymethylaminomethyl-2-thiouridine(34) oxidoreductase MnmC [Martelella alba]TKI03851.1 bifunctional tRNA (5-methylaminomethyl-2-thiouridine)(34)-methyltransferase MnmD/FAD-dependent 5-carboxymethylaminomethyl-2-thiouridine(34) oxidoreductase MnmC [Martelella alba]
MSRLPIRQAVLDWNEQGTPVSRQFDDVYFSSQDGLAETRYVFLRGNDLPERLIRHPCRHFRVAETGFGTGLNFLALWRAFALCRHERLMNPQGVRHLHFISIEQYPLSAEDLALAHGQWPELADYAEQLRRAWPPAVAGCHRLLLGEGEVTLDLWFGEANEVLAGMDDSLHRQVDAWFLDGFAPARNPAMWTDGLFQYLARFTRPGGTFATFTAAGFVRRGLQQAGFAVKKLPGFGKKREMAIGRLTQTTDVPVVAPWYQRQRATLPRGMAVIGGGIAGALCAAALTRRGAEVSLYCADPAPAQGASGNRQGALYPLLNCEDPALTRYFACAFPFASRYYRHCADRGMAFEHQWCGVAQLAYDARSARKIRRMLALGWPATLVRETRRGETARLIGVETGCDSAIYPLGGWLNPAQFTAALLRHEANAGLKLHYGHDVAHLERTADGWLLHFTDGRTALHPLVVLANGHRLRQWPMTRPLPLTNIRGQVSHIPAVAGLAGLRQVICYDGYLTPASPGYGTHSLGASAVRDDEHTEYRQSEQQQNLARLENCLPGRDWISHIDISAGQARCAIRCSARDHLPMVGNVPDYPATLAAYRVLPDLLSVGATATAAPCLADLFMLGALGSRGLCSAPLAAEILAAQIFGEPLPMEGELAAALNPNRFWIRKLLKGKEL